MRKPALLLTALACVTLNACTPPSNSPPPATTLTTTKGQTLVDPSGMTLYTFDRDADGKSACNGSCAKNWPPFSAASSTASGAWSVVTRDDGSKQWAYKGKPLYTWAKDTKPGDVTGDGFNNVWHVAQP